MSNQESNRILCVGLTPCLQRTVRFGKLKIGEVNRARSVSVSSGGKAINVARTLKALQESPLVTGFEGGDTGRAMSSYLREGGIETDFVRTSQATRVCMTLIDETTASVTELVEEAPLPTTYEWVSLHEKYRSLLQSADMMVLAGSPPPGSPEDIYAGFARRARETGCVVLLDARGTPLSGALPQEPLLAKLNELELGATCERSIVTEGDLCSSARSLLESGARWVLVTRGKEDAWLLSETEGFRYMPPAVETLNPIGSGDATTAGIVVGLRRGQSMPDAVRFGIACGSASATSLIPGDLDARLVEGLVPRVRVERMSPSRPRRVLAGRGPEQSSI